MKSSKCTYCSQRRNCNDSFTSRLFVVIGLIATLSIRLVTLLFHLSATYARIAWYIAIVGFIIFFLYKFKISKSRAELITKRNLVDKMLSGQPISGEERKIIGQLLCSLNSRNERINFFFIFFLSVLALIAAVYVDFIN